MTEVIINGTSLAVSSKTNAGTTMTGSKFSTNDNGIVFYGRLKSGTLPTDCELSVTNNGKTYERTITGKHLTGRTAYTLGAFSTTGANAWSLKESRPDGALPGKFSVADDRQVYFSQGNLWADGSGNFHFESAQTHTNNTFQTREPSDGDVWCQEHVTNFYWSTDKSKAYAKSAPSDGSTDDVFFTNATPTTPNKDFIVDGQKGVWRTLSIEEWQYLFSYGEKTHDVRTGLYTLYSSANSVQCVVLYPDGYSKSKIKENYSADEYTAATAEGVVFLPRAGLRKGSDMESIGHYLYCWSSSTSGEGEAYVVFVLWEISTQTQNPVAMAVLSVL